MPAIGIGSDPGDIEVVGDRRSFGDNSERKYQGRYNWKVG